MYKIPRWWRRFRFAMTYQDLITGRKVAYEYIDIKTGLKKLRVERVK
jgi:hypothetical protein